MTKDSEMEHVYKCLNGIITREGEGLLHVALGGINGMK